MLLDWSPATGTCLAEEEHLDRQLRECAPSLPINPIQHTWAASVRERHLPLVATCLLSVWVIHQISGCLVASEILDKGILPLFRTLHRNKSALSQIGQLISPTIFSKPSTSACTSIYKSDTTGQLPKDASDYCIRLVNNGKPTEISPWNNHLQWGQTKCQKYTPSRKVLASPFWY